MSTDEFGETRNEIQEGSDAEVRRYGPRPEFFRSCANDACKLGGALATSVDYRLRATCLKDPPCTSDRSMHVACAADTFVPRKTVFSSMTRTHCITRPSQPVSVDAYFVFIAIYEEMLRQQFYYRGHRSGKPGKLEISSFGSFGR